MKSWVIAAMGGYYNGYTDKGPIIVESPARAFRFGAKWQAENVLGGDERLKGSQILVSELAPNV